MEGRPVRFYTNDEAVPQVNKEDVLLVWDGSIGKCASGLEGAIGSTLVALTPKGKIPTRFLEYLIRYLNPYIKETSTGTGLQHINKNFFKECIIPIPPLSEQHRIVAKLEALLARVNNSKTRLNKIPAILKNFRRSVLAAAFSGELTKEWREEKSEIENAKQLINRVSSERKERYAEAVKKAKQKGIRKPTDFDNYEVNLKRDFDLSELPNAWEWVDFRFLMAEDKAFCYGVVQPGVEDINGNYLIRAGDIKNNSVDTWELRTISKAVDNEYLRSKVEGGEILITVVGAGIGECGIVPDNCNGYNIARAVAKVPIKDFDSKYILYWLNTSTAINWMKGESREVARPTLNLEQLKTIPIPLAPIEEQKEIVRKVEELFHFADSIEARYQKAKTWFDKIPQAILSKAFRGELVEQDESDEPASVLLERIKQEKKESNKPKPASKRKKVYVENDDLSMAAEE
jgi:type I restriction enzyme, S subunit